MDIYCPVCAEPWDNDELHEAEGLTYAQASRMFREKGCGAVFGGKCEPDGERADLASAMYDLLGDDMDGAAAMFEDMGW